MASAQTAPPRFALFYGVSGGPGRRTTAGTFLRSSLPTGAKEPESKRTTATLGLHLGVKLAPRLGVLAVWDQTFGGNTGDGHWGASAVHAAARVWLMPRVWVEAGAGPAELGYKPPTQPASTISRFWTPGFEAAAGADLLKGPRVALTALARYSAATFNGLRVDTFSLQVGLTGVR
jgi:hypothetical protein